MVGDFIVIFEAVMYFTPTSNSLRGKCQANYKLMIATFTTPFLCAPRKCVLWRHYSLLEFSATNEL